MSPGEIDVQVVRRHLAALRESLQVLSTRRDLSLDELDTNTQERWMVERGLQLCAQNALDIAMCRTTPAPSTSSGASAC